MKSAAKSGLVGKVAGALERTGLRPGQLIVAAISGGPDSVALLHVLRGLQRRFGYRLAAAHLNHHLRGAESDRDAEFVSGLCETLGIELRVGHAHGLRATASNLEERAREARYDFLRSVAKELRAAAIATAHHADDQAETVMLRLLRGAGAAGLSAMAERSAEPPAAMWPGAVLIRPMLRVWRDEIAAYLDSINARFVTDSTNLDVDLLRNRVRLELLPALERDFAPGLRRRLAALADEMRELDDFVAIAAREELERRMRDAAPGNSLDLEGFSTLNPALATALLRSFVAARIGNLRRLSRRHFDGLTRLCLNESPSATLDLPGGWRAERRYGVLVIERSIKYDPRSARAAFAVALAREGVTAVPQANFVFHSTEMPADAVPLPESLFEACFDAERAASGLVVRNFMRGDRIAPFGMKGSRKLHDIFVDRKLGRARRATFPVVTVDSEVAWLPGMARGRVALITPATSRVLRLRAHDGAARA